MGRGYKRVIVPRGPLLQCLICGGSLGGRHRVFCSRKCKNVDTNLRHQLYRKQQERGRARKLELIARAGGACVRCGYKRNYAALEFHHVGLKSFQLDLRSLSNRTWTAISAEIEKCILVCGNCHAELHNPDCVMPAEAVGLVTQLDCDQSAHNPPDDESVRRIMHEG